MSESYSLIDPCDLLTPALEVSIEAGSRILEIYERGFEVSQKADETPLTEADVAASRIIEEGLARLSPSLPVLSEESESIAFHERQTWSRYWLVDPLDGTREFINRTGEFTVNVALIDNGEPVIGIVYAPVLGVYYYACRGQGAYKRSACNQPRRIYARQQTADPVVVAISNSYRSGEALQNFLQALGPFEVRAVGSALKSCLVAEGEADIYARLGPTSEWDTAAAQCILEEAGGQLTDTAMQPLRYNTKSSLLNPHFFAFGDKSRNWSDYLSSHSP